MRTNANWRELEQRILKVIKTPVRPVAVAFLNAEPAGVEHRDAGLRAGPA